MSTSVSAVPRRLYRYRDTGEYTEKIFTKRELNFAKPGSFNDPFDCGFHILCQGEGSQEVIESQAFETVKRARPEWSDEKVFDTAELVGAKIMAEHNEEASRQYEMSLAREYNDRAGRVQSLPCA